MWQDIHDSIDPLPIPEPAGFPWWVVALGVAVAVAAVCVTAIRWRRARRVYAVSPGTACERARRSLTQLQREDSKVFYSALTGIVTSYLHDQFSLDTAHSTSREIAGQARATGHMTEACEASLVKLLDLCDRGKFGSGLGPGPGSASELAQSVVDQFALSVATSPRLAKPAEPGDHAAF